MIVIQGHEINDFLMAYMVCALWSSHEASNEPNPDPLESNFSIYDLTDEAIGKMKADCEKFVKENDDLLASSDLEQEQQGHDFWLTRNRHGSGYWDRGLGEIGEKLTEAAHGFGEAVIYNGDDGKIYHY